MVLNSIEQLYTCLCNFRVVGSEEGIDFGRINAFWEVSSREIEQVEQQLGFMIPHQLREFYLNVGHGQIKVDEHGTSQLYYLNIIVEPSRLLSLWDRTDVSYQVGDELIDNGEMPFFDMGDHNYLVLRPNDGEAEYIYYPYDKKPLAKDFNEFITKLYENTTFYNDHEGVYED